MEKTRNLGEIVGAAFLVVVFLGGCDKTPTTPDPPPEPPVPGPPVPGPPPIPSCSEMRGDDCQSWVGECLCPSDYFPLWEDIEDTRFGRRPYPSTPYWVGISQSDTDVIWDAIRNPSRAIDCHGDWPYNGVFREDAIESVARAEVALKRLRKFVRLEWDRSVRKDIALSGNWLDEHPLFENRSRVRKRFFNDFWNDVFYPVWLEGSKLNGVCSICPGGRCP